jgi:hypothetical protein
MIGAVLASILWNVAEIFLRRASYGKQAEFYLDTMKFWVLWLVSKVLNLSLSEGLHSASIHSHLMLMFVMKFEV